MPKPLINTRTGEIVSSVKKAAKMCNLEYSYFIKMLKDKIRNSTVFQYYNGTKNSHKVH